MAVLKKLTRAKSGQSYCQFRKVTWSSFGSAIFVLKEECLNPAPEFVL